MKQRNTRCSGHEADQAPQPTRTRLSALRSGCVTGKEIHMCIIVHTDNCITCLVTLNSGSSGSSSSSSSSWQHPPLSSVLAAEEGRQHIWLNNLEQHLFSLLVIRLYLYLKFFKKKEAKKKKRITCNSTLPLPEVFPHVQISFFLSNNTLLSHWQRQIWLHLDLMTLATH